MDITKNTKFYDFKVNNTEEFYGYQISLLFFILKNLNNTLLQFYAHESSRQWSTIVNEAEQSRLR